MKLKNVDGTSRIETMSFRYHGCAVEKGSEVKNNGRHPNRECKKKQIQSEGSILGKDQMELFLDKFIDFVKNRKGFKRKKPNWTISVNCRHR